MIRRRPVGRQVTSKHTQHSTTDHGGGANRFENVEEERRVGRNLRGIPHEPCIDGQHRCPKRAIATHRHLQEGTFP